MSIHQSLENNVMSPPAVNHWADSVLGLSMRESACIHDCQHDVLNRLLQFHQIYNFVVNLLGTTMNLLDFKVEKSKIKVTVRPNAFFWRRHTNRWFSI